MQDCYIIMGVSGSGKTSVGRALAERLHLPFYDGDDFHPPENIEKMASGYALNDDDRAGWLEAIQNFIDREGSEGIIIACSALKKKYRAVLIKSKYPVRFIYLKGDFETIMNRVTQRSDHFMPPSLLRSQFSDLEEPDDAIVVSIKKSIPDIIERIVDLGDAAF